MSVVFIAGTAENVVDAETGTGGGRWKTIVGDVALVLQRKWKVSLDKESEVSRKKRMMGRERTRKIMKRAWISPGMNPRRVRRKLSRRSSPTKR